MELAEALAHGRRGTGWFSSGDAIFLGGSEKTWNTYASSIFKGDYKMFTSISNYFRLKRCSSSDVVFFFLKITCLSYVCLNIFGDAPVFWGDLISHRLVWDFKSQNKPHPRSRTETAMPGGWEGCRAHSREILGGAAQVGPLGRWQLWKSKESGSLLSVW